MANRLQMHFSDSGKPSITLTVANSTRPASDVTKSQVTEIAADAEQVGDANRLGSELEPICHWMSASICGDYIREARIHFVRDQGSDV